MKKALLIGGGLIIVIVVGLLLMPVPADFGNPPEDRMTKEQREFCSMAAASADAGRFDDNLCDPDNKASQKTLRELAEGDRS